VIGGSSKRSLPIDLAHFCGEPDDDAAETQPPGWAALPWRELPAFNPTPA